MDIKYCKMRDESPVSIYLLYEWNAANIIWVVYEINEFIADCKSIITWKMIFRETFIPNNRHSTTIALNSECDEIVIWENVRYVLYGNVIIVYLFFSITDRIFIVNHIFITKSFLD